VGREGFRQPGRVITVTQREQLRDVSAFPGQKAKAVNKLSHLGAAGRSAAASGPQPAYGGGVKPGGPGQLRVSDAERLQDHGQFF
jgi:hypothetical protein